MLTLGDAISRVLAGAAPLATERVSLGLKQVSEDPWVSVAEKYHIGDRVKVNIVDIDLSRRQMELAIVDGESRDVGKAPYSSWNA